MHEQTSCASLFSLAGCWIPSRASPDLVDPPLSVNASQSDFHSSDKPNRASKQQGMPSARPGRGWRREWPHASVRFHCSPHGNRIGCHRSSRCPHVADSIFFLRVKTNSFHKHKVTVTIRIHRTVYVNRKAIVPDRVYSVFPNISSYLMGNSVLRTLGKDAFPVWLY
jgi:hypothetical protein